jgi:hypothetical protein
MCRCAGGVGQIVFLLPETLRKSGPRRSSNPILALKLFLDPTLLVLVRPLLGPPQRCLCVHQLTSLALVQFLEGAVAGGCLLLVLFIFPVRVLSSLAWTVSHHDAADTDQRHAFVMAPFIRSK